MSRYIDADKALKDADTIDLKYAKLIEQVKNIIKAQPTADVEPVRRGKWIDEGVYANGWGQHAFRCSECGKHILELDTLKDVFCRFCGAKMDGDRDEL